MADQSVAANAWALLSAAVLAYFTPYVHGQNDMPASIENHQAVDLTVVAKNVPNQPGVAVYTVQSGEDGFYAISDSSLHVADEQPSRIEFRLFVRRATLEDARQPAPAVLACLDAGDVFDFDTFLGYLNAGDSVHISVSTDGREVGDGVEADYRIGRTPLIPVSVFPEDVTQDSTNPLGNWHLMANVPTGSAAARLLAWGNPPNAKDAIFTLSGSAAQVQLNGDSSREAVAAFRVPQSGYYALHDAWASSAAGNTEAIEARVYVGRNAPRAPLAAIPVTGSDRVSLNTDLGYVERGDVIYLAFRSESGPAVVEFAGSVVEWAPRRPPLRVRRKADSYLDVYEPAAPRKAIDVPPDRWVIVPFQEGDATEVIRNALAKAQALQKDGVYTGIRLEAGRTYVVGTDQVGGTLFEIKDCNRLVFDGNGATLLVNSSEAQRQGVRLFTASASHHIVLADFAVESSVLAYTVGDIVDVGPLEHGNQTVIFQIPPNAPDPVADIRRTGMAEGYAYDPEIPGRLAEGNWSHYPGGVDVRPQLQPAQEGGLFTHTVTRTGQAIRAGAKWLVKNKGGGVHYLRVDGPSEDITLTGVEGRASAGGFLTFWQASGVNVLNCRFEPQGTNWINSTSDGFHGRGREGVWIENTLVRGVCEDVLNTYALSMVVVADEGPDDRVVSLRLFNPGQKSPNGDFLLGEVTEGTVLVGDELVFFNSQSGQVLSYARVLGIADGRFALSKAVPGIDPWDPGDGKNATMVYNTRQTGRFFVRDSRVMDSMRFGVFVKARCGVIFNSQFEGLASVPIFAANEPEWPEGPPPTHLWLQGNTFSQNNYDYCGRHRAYLTVDPANISVYTRRLRNSTEPPSYRSHLTRGQYANSHMKIVGNTFHDWRGMGIAVRNARNVHIADNLFLPPIDDGVLRETLAQDPALTRDTRGRYAAIFMDSVRGARLSGNRFYGLPDGDQSVVLDQDVDGVVEADNLSAPISQAGLGTVFSFSEWFGSSSSSSATGANKNLLELNGAVRQAGRLGAGLVFNGRDTPVVFHQSASDPVAQFSLALWIRSDRGNEASEVIYQQGDVRSGIVIGVHSRRLVTGLWHDEQGEWLDLGPVVTGLWQHLALVYDGSPNGELRGFIDGVQVASAKVALRRPFDAISRDAAFGGVLSKTRIGANQVLTAGEAAYQGGIDEVYFFRRAIDPVHVACLALRRPIEPTDGSTP